MGQRGISREVERFVHDHLTSVAQLEILLLLYRRSHHALSGDQVAEELRIDPEWASTELGRLTSQGLLSSGDSERPAYQFAPSRPADAGLVDEVARLFATHRVSIITLIFSSPNDSVGSFADAFKIRRDDDG